MSSRELRDRIRRRAKKTGLELDEGVAAQLEQYYLLLSKWNEKINLTAYRLTSAGDDESVDRLLIEPVIAAQHVSRAAVRAMDVGSGGGSPAIPLKIASPQLSMTMVEIKTRKAVFLREAVRELGLPDTYVETTRFEEMLSRPELHEGLDLVTIRAVRVETRTLLTLQAFLKPGGQIFLFRGPSGADVADSVPPPMAWQATFPLVDSLRSKLIVLSKQSIGKRST